MEAVLKDHEFTQFQQLIYRIAGISMSEAKKPLVSGRLANRIRHFRLASYGEYFQLLSSGDHPEEMQMLVDLLTTNETYFFREPRHFDYLREKILPHRERKHQYRVWSAACSSGQEAYSVAMLLADKMSGGNWEIMASDISTRVLEAARRGQYPLEQSKNIPQVYLQKYCLRGTGPEEGTFLIDKPLRDRIQFRQINLNGNLPHLGEFDLVFLRNVMIYFDIKTKREVVLRIMERMRNGSYLIIGHSESLNGVINDLKPAAPSIYCVHK